MKISLITVCYNSGSTIRDTLRSVTEQKYTNLEYIVIDGGSEDQTVPIIRQNMHGVNKFVSEPDHGIYDAMNKGISFATGEVVGFINSDDFYASESVLDTIADVFSDKNLDACYGDICYVSKKDPFYTLRYWKSSQFKPHSFKNGWCPPHPTFFVRREVYERFGTFDLTYKIAADVELMMRFLEVHRIRSKYIPQTLVNMRAGGASNRGICGIIKQNLEIIQALKKHAIAFSVFFFIKRKLSSRIKQFLGGFFNIR